MPPAATSPPRASGPTATTQPAPATAEELPSKPEAIVTPPPDVVPKGQTSSSSKVTVPAAPAPAAPATLTATPAGTTPSATPATTPATTPAVTPEGKLPPPVVLQPGTMKPSGTPTIMLHLKNADIASVLEMVSRQANMSITIAPGVRGQITLDLRNKTIDETLKIIARLCRLTIRTEQDVIYVSAEEDALPIRVYHLNYISAKDLIATIGGGGGSSSSSGSGGSGGGGGGGKAGTAIFLSSKGKISKSPDSKDGLMSDVSSSSGGSNGTSTQEVKAGGNSMAGGEIVIVQDYEEILKKVDRVIAELDVEPIQVLIEAVIIQVDLTKDMELGVNFPLLDKSGTALGVVGDGAAINAAAGFNPASVLAAGGKLAGTATSGFAEDANGVKFGWVGNNTTGFLPRALRRIHRPRSLPARESWCSTSNSRKSTLASNWAT